MISNNWRTAIVRKRPSVPARWLESQGLLVGRMLDYGCGRGTDADFYGMDKYDPYWYNVKPKGTYDTITCAFVLNVVDYAAGVLRAIKILLAPRGFAYITVRRDLPGHLIRNGYTQWNRQLNAESIRSNSKHEIYRIRK